MTPKEVVDLLAGCSYELLRRMSEAKDLPAAMEVLKFQLSESRTKCCRLADSNAALLEKVETMQKEVDRLGAELLKSNRIRAGASNEMLYYGPGGPGSIASGLNNPPF
jgi:hypothetical protein